MSMRSRPVVAIDGPVGAGKSTVARELARQLGFDYLNTGAMYRALAVAAGYNGIGADDPALDTRLGKILKTIAITFEGERVLLNGRDISAEISTPEIGDLASRLSTRAVVRGRMRELQRAAGQRGGVVVEGRDIGTAVFPDAECKFFLTAESAVRAARRFAEFQARGIAADQAEVLAQLEERDRRDRERELAPLRCADDAMVVDSSALSIAEVVRVMKAHVEKVMRDIRA